MDADNENLKLTDNDKLGRAHQIYDANAQRELYGFRMLFAGLCPRPKASPLEGAHYVFGELSRLRETIELLHSNLTKAVAGNVVLSERVVKLEAALQDVRVWRDKPRVVEEIVVAALARNTNT